MKKTVSFILALFMLAGVLSGCVSGSGDARLSIVTTIFPPYDWVREMLGEQISDVELTLLQDSGVDLHSYQPTADDMVKISTCDVFIYVGGESDEWVEDALKNATNENMVVINLMEVLQDALLEPQTTEGMQTEHEEQEHEHHHEYDEHIWLSLTNAQTACGYIARQLSRIDGDNEAVYTANANRYIEKLDQLHAQYQHTVDTAAFDTLLFADRFPFLYLTRDYGLNYYAAFSGCSAESEASFETIAFLAGKLDELALPSVLIIDNGDDEIAKTVIDNTAQKNQTILTLCSMQSVTAQDVADGVTYLSIMEQNLQVLEEALN